MRRLSGLRSLRGWRSWASAHPQSPSLAFSAEPRAAPGVRRWGRSPLGLQQVDKRPKGKSKDSLARPSILLCPAGGVDQYIEDVFGEMVTSDTHLQLLC